MARYKFQGTARDGNGRVIPECTATVYLAGGTTLATCYDDESGGSAISDSQITASSVGYFEFWVDDSDYASTQKFKIIIAKANFSTSTYDDLVVIPVDSNDKTAINSTGTAGYLLDKVTAGDGVVITSSEDALVFSVDWETEGALDSLGGEPADSTILKDADIGNTVQGYDEATSKTDENEVRTARISGTISTLSNVGGTISWNMNTDQNATVALASNATLANPSNQINGTSGVLVTEQDSTGGYTLSFGSNFATSPSIDTDADAVNVMPWFVFDGEIYIYLAEV